MAAPSVHAVIMAGGSGTRFWPLSRAGKPKQFLALATGKPLIAETAERLTGLVALADVLVVCGQRHRSAVRTALPKLPPRNVLVEPEARNTAPAIALAALHVFHQDPDGVVVVLPSDQHVADPGAFRAAIAEAVRVASTGAIVTLGITPTRAETGYGYIRLGAPTTGTARAVAAFAEKPDAATARRYLDSGEYLWNAGLFVFTARAMLQALVTHLPGARLPLQRLGEAWGTRKQQQVLEANFKKLPAISIDYGVAEKEKNIQVVPCDCGWSDVGSFDALSEVRPTDADGNVVLGEGALVLGTRGSVVVGSGRPLAVVGMVDVVVVDAGDAILVVPRSKSQDVRQAVEALKAKKLLKYL
jgi:mannose-1-phosphate guanylyltransferase